MGTGNRCISSISWGTTCFLILLYMQGLLLSSFPEKPFIQLVYAHDKDGLIIIIAFLGISSRNQHGWTAKEKFPGQRMWMTQLWSGDYPRFRRSLRVVVRACLRAVVDHHMQTPLCPSSSLTLPTKSLEYLCIIKEWTSKNSFLQWFHPGWRQRSLLPLPNQDRRFLSSTYSPICYQFIKLSLEMTLNMLAHKSPSLFLGPRLGILSSSQRKGRSKLMARL